MSVFYSVSGSGLGVSSSLEGLKIAPSEYLEKKYIPRTLILRAAGLEKR